MYNAVAKTQSEDAKTTVEFLLPYASDAEAKSLKCGSGNDSCRMQKSGRTQLLRYQFLWYGAGRVTAMEVDTSSIL